MSNVQESFDGDSITHMLDYCLQAGVTSGNSATVLVYNSTSVMNERYAIPREVNIPYVQMIFDNVTTTLRQSFGLYPQKLYYQGNLLLGLQY